MNITIPLIIDPKSNRFNRSEATKSIDSFLNLLISTPRGSCACDLDFGYSLSNLRFEIFNETEGMVSKSDRSYYETPEDMALYSKKISGISTNYNTFAKEMKSMIEEYESRLTDIEVTMNYIKNLRIIKVSITAVIAHDGSPYSFETTINTWNRI